MTALSESTAMNMMDEILRVNSNQNMGTTISVFSNYKNKAKRLGFSAEDDSGHLYQNIEEYIV